MEKLISKIDKKIRESFTRLKAYIKRLLFPLHLFPIKIITYSIYYLIKFTFKLLISLIKIILETIVYPFKGLKNLIKFIFALALVVYVLASLFVILDYLRTQYGHYGKILCSYGVQDKLKGSVVRVVGGYSEGSGFFISSNQVLTNFHVIAGEPSPKIILPDGSFITPNKIIGDSWSDLALLFTEKYYPEFVLPLQDDFTLVLDEPLIATGYAMGTDLSGKATILRGNFIDFRHAKGQLVGYIQTNISLVDGMSGGPLTDQCGQVVGVSTAGLAGLSLFINGAHVRWVMGEMTDQEISKINVDPSLSPEAAVEAFYTYLKARRMEDGFNLLSKEYLQKTNFEEWTNRFTDILDVDVILTEPYEGSEDTVFVKFGTKNWNEGEVEYHYYEGTWQTILEDGVYKMLRSKIKEVEDPGWEWFWE